MTKSAPTVGASSPVRSVKKTTTTRRIRAPVDGEVGSSSGCVAEREAAVQPSCPQQGLLLDLSLPLPYLNGFDGVAPDAAARSQVAPLGPMLEAQDFTAPVCEIPPASRRSSWEPLRAERDLRSAVATLVEQNRAQADAIEDLRIQWATWHDELEERVCDLERSTRVHQGILAEFLGRKAVPRLHEDGHPEADSLRHWKELKELIQEQRHELSCLRSIVCAQRHAVLSGGGGRKRPLGEDECTPLLAEGSEAWDERAILSDSPFSWTAKLFSWSSAVDDLPVAELGSDEPIISASRSSGSASGEEAEAEPDGTADVEAAHQQGLHAVLLETGGGLSVEALQDAEGFCTFISGASLEQQSWMRTLATFAITAAPIATLTCATTLKLQLLDRAVCLPGTNLLLLVAQSTEPLPVPDKHGSGKATTRADLRVLSVLSLTNAMERGVCISALSTDTVLHVSAFEAFCMSVERRDGDGAHAGDSKPVLLAVCSLRDLEIIKPATAATTCNNATRIETGSSGSGGESRSRSASPHFSEPRKRGERCLMNDQNGYGVNESERSCSKRSSSNWSIKPAEDMLVGRWISSSKRRKMPLKADNWGYEYSEFRQHHMVQKRGLFSSHRQPLVPRPEQPAAADRPRPPFDSSLLVSNGAKARALFTSSSCAESTCSTASSDSGPRVSNCGVQSRHQDTCQGESCIGNRRGKLRTLPARSEADGRSAAPASAVAANDRRSAVAAVRCSGLAAQKQQHHLWDQLPRVRVVVPKAVREQLPSFECEDCAAFFQLMGSNVAVPSCTHRGSTDMCNSSHSCSVFRSRIRSRHKSFAPPTSTPPGYWDL